MPPHTPLFFDDIDEDDGVVSLSLLVLPLVDDEVDSSAVLSSTTGRL
jgi:hypothetical protein